MHSHPEHLWTKGALRGACNRRHVTRVCCSRCRRRRACSCPKRQGDRMKVLISTLIAAPTLTFFISPACAQIANYPVATVPPLARALAGDHVDGERPEHRAAELIWRARWAKEDPCKLLGEGRPEDREGQGALHGRTPRTERNHRSMTNGVRSMPAVKQVTVKSRSHLKRLESYLNRDRDKALDHGTQNLTRTGSARSCMREMDATREGDGHNWPGKANCACRYMEHQCLAFNPDECDVNGGKSPREDRPSA